MFIHTDMQTLQCDKTLFIIQTVYIWYYSVKGSVYLSFIAYFMALK